MEPRYDERTFYEAMGDISYNCRYYLLQQRFFGKLAGTFRFISIVSGSAAFAGFVSVSPALAGGAGVVVAVVTALDIIINPGQKAYTCNEVMRRYRELERQARNLDLDALEDRLAELRAMEAPSIEALRVPAYNDSCKERGRTDQLLPASYWHRFVALIA